MQTRPDFANRVSYVIAPNGKVVYSYLSLNPNKHVERTLAAVAEFQKAAQNVQNVQNVQTDSPTR
jgi:peroxiredoxin